MEPVATQYILSDVRLLVCLITERAITGNVRIALKYSGSSPGPAGGMISGSVQSVGQSISPLLPLRTTPSTPLRDYTRENLDCLVKFFLQFTREGVMLTPLCSNKYWVESTKSDIGTYSKEDLYAINQIYPLSKTKTPRMSA